MEASLEAIIIFWVRMMRDLPRVLGMRVKRKEWIWRMNEWTCQLTGCR